MHRKSVLERRAIEGKGPVSEMQQPPLEYPK
jgi:hypothetical protein